MSNSLDPDKDSHSVGPGPEVIKLCSCSAEHEISTAHKN